MPCNCGGGQAKNASNKYIYTDGNGRQQSFNTEIEAKAARIRAGGGGSIRTESK
jgi:hypothetical protein